MKIRADQRDPCGRFRSGFGDASGSDPAGLLNAVPESQNGFPMGVSFGFLTYDMQPFTEDCLHRVSQAIQPSVLKAFPVMHHAAQAVSRVRYMPSTQTGRYLPVNRAGSTPEGFASNVNLGAAWRCASESDVVVLFGLQGATALLAALFARLRGKPIVSVNQTLPVEWERCRRWWVRAAKDWLLSRCVVHVSQTPATLDVLTEVYGVPLKTIVIAPFEAGAGWFRMLLDAAAYDECPVPRESSEQFIVLFAGNLHPFKGVLLLLDALAQISDRGKLLFVFAGPEESGNAEWGSIDSYLRYADQLGVLPQVRFTGRVTPECLASLYQCCDIVVLPTFRDMFPKVLVEGALAGKPLITTSANGAAGSMVVDGVNGFVIAPGDSVALSDRINRLREPALRIAMGAQSRQIVDQFCDAELETRGFVIALNRALQYRKSGPMLTPGVRI